MHRPYENLGNRKDWERDRYERVSIGRHNRSKKVGAVIDNLRSFTFYFLFPTFSPSPFPLSVERRDIKVVASGPLKFQRENFCGYQHY
jgi:hypothetical protein